VVTFGLLREKHQRHRRQQRELRHANELRRAKLLARNSRKRDVARSNAVNTEYKLPSLYFLRGLGILLNEHANLAGQGVPREGLRQHVHSEIKEVSTESCFLGVTADEKHL
jgi:hypothetical protein